MSENGTLKATVTPSFIKRMEGMSHEEITKFIEDSVMMNNAPYDRYDQIVYAQKCLLIG